MVYKAACNSHSFIVGQPIKTTYSGYAGPNYIVNCDFLFVLSCACNTQSVYPLRTSCHSLLAHHVILVQAVHTLSVHLLSVPFLPVHFLYVYLLTPYIVAPTTGRDLKLSIPQLGHNLTTFNISTRTGSIQLLWGELSTPLPQGAIFSYQCLNLDTILQLSMSQLGHDPQPVYQNRESLLSQCNQVRVSISISVFEVYMSQFKAYRLNNNSYVAIYIT